MNPTRRTQSSALRYERTIAVAVSRRLTAGVIGTGKSQSAERLSYVAAALPENLRTRWVLLDPIRTVDQNPDSLLNCNTPEDFVKAAQLSGSAPA